MRLFFLSLVACFGLNIHGQAAILDTLTASKMKEVTITASKIVMFQDGDTLVYNADALMQEQGAMLDALIAQLPGVELEADGRILVNGQRVSALLINGREFFQGDPKVALENLPSYTVGKVKVYRQAPKTAYLTRNVSETGARPDDPLVMDVRLKKKYHEGWLANVDVAGGKKTEPHGAGVYWGRLFGINYNDLRTLGGYASANNLKESGRMYGRGSWSDISSSEGRFTSRNAGLNISGNDAAKKTEYRSQFVAKHTTKDLSSEGLTTSFLETGDWHSHNRQQSAYDKTEYNWDGELRYYAPRASVEMSAMISYLKQDYDGNAHSETSAEQGDGTVTFLNARSTRTAWTYEDLDMNGCVRANIKTPWKNRTLGMELKGQYARRDNWRDMVDVIRYAGSGANERQHAYERSPERNYSWQGKVYFPLVSYQRGLQNLTINVEYLYSQSRKSDEACRYRLDRLTTPDSVYALGNLPSMDSLLQVMDWHNSHHTVTLDKSHQGCVNVSYMTGRIMSVSINLPVMMRRSTVRDEREHTERTLSREFTLFQPSVNVSIGKFFFSYSYHVLPPPLFTLLSIMNDTNPLQLSMGNASLRSEKDHQISGSFRQFWFRQQASFNARLSYVRKDDAHGMARYYHPETGGVTLRPENVDGNWTASGNIRYERRLGYQRRFRLTTDLSGRYAHSVDFAYTSAEDDATRQMVRDCNIEEGVTLEYSFQRLSLGCKERWKWNHATNSRESFRTINYSDLQYGVFAQWRFGKGFELVSDFTMNSRRGYGEAGIDEDELLWNASLSYGFGRNRSWTLKAVGYDLLHQHSAVRHHVNAHGRWETRYNSVPSYAMLHLIYRLDPKPRK